MTTVTLKQAQDQLAEILEHLQPGEEITITDHGQPLARLTKAGAAGRSVRAGCYRKAEFRMAADFDAPLEDFKEYTE